MAGIRGPRAAFCLTAALLSAPVNLSWFGPGPFAALLIVGAAASAWLAGGLARRMRGRDHGWRAIALTGVLYTLVVGIAFGGWGAMDELRAGRDAMAWYELPLFALGVSPFVAIVVVPAVLAGGALFQLGLFIVARGWLRAARPGLGCLAVAVVAVAILAAERPADGTEKTGAGWLDIFASVALLGAVVGLAAWGAMLVIRRLRSRAAARGA